MRKFLFEMHFSVFDVCILLFSVNIISSFADDGQVIKGVFFWLIILFIGTVISILGEHWDEVKELWAEVKSEKAESE